MKKALAILLAALTALSVMLLAVQYSKPVSAEPKIPFCRI